MTFKIGILGGGLQGTEAACLARWAGWESCVVDSQPQAPASGVADAFVVGDANDLKSFDKAFAGCDLVIPACENIATLELVTSWGQTNDFPVAFDLNAYRITCNKVLSKELFAQKNVPTPLCWPEASYPLIAKPISGSGSRGVELLPTPDHFSRKFPHRSDDTTKGWVVEEYCTGPSYSLEVSGRPGAYKTWLTTALEMDDIYDCCQVWAPSNISKASDIELRKISIDLAEALKLKGLMDIEVIASPQGLKVLEIDARLPSQTPTVVLWSMGENLLLRLAENFCAIKSPSNSNYSTPKAVIYEHIDVSSQGLVLAGEHLMSASGPLTLKENFQGADWAVTNFQPGQNHWVATLIIIDNDMDAARLRRKEILERLRANLPGATR